MESKRGREVHAQVEHTREAGDFWESIKIAQDAIRIYEEEKDYLGLSEIHGSISLAYRHLYRKTSEKNFLVLAEGAATVGIEIAKINGLLEAVALPTFNLAKVQEELGQLGEASVTYQGAVDAFIKNPPESHNRPGVIADMKVHLYTCKYKAGDKSALDEALVSLKELEESDEKTVSKYNYDVWLSGGHMRIAEMLEKDDLGKAKEHLEEAKVIIFSNPELKIRKEQWEELAKTFNA